MRELPERSGGKWRIPSTEKENRAERRYGDHAGVFSNKKHGELEAGIFGMESGDEFRLCFGQIERHAIGFRDGGNKKTKKANDLRKAAVKSKRVPGKQAPFAVLLLADNFGQAKTVRHEHNAHDRHGHGKFVADHLRGATQAAEERVLAVRGPAGKGDTVHAKSGDGEKHKKPNVGICDPQVNLMAKEFEGKRIWSKGNDGKGCERKCKSQKRREQIDELVDAARHDVFLESKL